MTKTQTELLRRALELLHRLVPDDYEPCAVDSAPRRCPVAEFARKFLVPDPESNLTSEELLCFFNETAASGEVQPLSKSRFLRRLPNVLETTFGVRKSHGIERDGRRVRGFRGIGIRMDNAIPPVNLVRSSSSNGGL